MECFNYRISALYPFRRPPRKFSLPALRPGWDAIPQASGRSGSRGEALRDMPGQHPDPQILERFMRNEAGAQERRAVILHLLTGCAQCVAVTRRLWSLADAPPELVTEGDAAYSRVLDDLARRGSRRQRRLRAHPAAAPPPPAGAREPPPAPAPPEGAGRGGLPTPGGLRAVDAAQT